MLGINLRIGRAHVVALFVLQACASLGAGAALLGCPMESDTESPGLGGETPTLDASPSTDASGGDASPDANTDASSPRDTHSGLVSVQDIAIANVPQAGHGLTVNVFFNALRKPDYEENPGAIAGCRGWSYDVASNPPNPEEDHGALSIAGIAGGDLACSFRPGRSYVCPTATGTATASTALANGLTAYTLPGASFTSADVGRYLQISGATTATNNGAFAIVAVLSATEVVVANMAGAAESFAATYTVVAGAGPTPNDLYTPFGPSAKIAVGITPGGGGAFAFPTTTLTPGGAFTLDDPTRALLTAVPLDGRALHFGCASCGEADGTIVRITTTDGDVTGLSPVAMPPPKKRAVELQCLVLGGTTVDVSAAASKLLAEANAASPITRVRTAFMRDGLALVGNAAPKPKNTTALAVGRGILGFTTP